MVLGTVLVVLAVVGCAYWNPLWFATQQIRWTLRRAGVESRFVQVEGRRIHYFEAPARGGGPGRPLVLVHGLGGRGEDWSPMLAELAGRGFHVYAPDLLGYGRSERPDVSYSMAMEAGVVEGFMTAVGVPRADVAGWSMGGWVAMLLTLDYPERVDRLVVMDSAGVRFPATYDATLFTPTDVAGVHRLLGMLTPRTLPIPDFLARALVRSLAKSKWVIDRSLASMTGGADQLDGRLGSVRQPMLIVWGAQDALIPISAGEQIHRAVPQSRMAVMEGCGHLAPTECSKGVLGAMAEFLLAEPATTGGATIDRSPRGAGR